MTRSRARFDVPSALLSILTMIPVVYAVKETAAHGFSVEYVLVGVAGLLAGWVFVRRQRRLDDPMIDLRLFARPMFRTAIVTDFLSIFALAGVLFFGAQYLQVVLGVSPLTAGLLMLPGTAMSVVGSLAAAWLLRRWRAGYVLAGSVATTAVGAAMLLATPSSGSAPSSGSPVVFVVALLRDRRGRRRRPDHDLGPGGQLGPDRACRGGVGGRRNRLRTRRRDGCRGARQRRHGRVPARPRRRRD